MVDKDFVRSGPTVVRGDLGQFQNGTKRDIPPMFFKEWGSSVESMGCEGQENKSVQVVVNKEVTERVRKRSCSKRNGDFTKECSRRESTCQ